MEQHSESRMSQLSRLGNSYDAHPRKVLHNLQYNAFRTVVAAKLRYIHIPVQRLSLMKQLSQPAHSLGIPSDVLGRDLSCNGIAKLCTLFSMPGILDSSIPMQRCSLVRRHSQHVMIQLVCLGNSHDAHPRLILQNGYAMFSTPSSQQSYRMWPLLRPFGERPHFMHQGGAAIAIEELRDACMFSL